MTRAALILGLALTLTHACGPARAGQGGETTLIRSQPPVSWADIWPTALYSRKAILGGIPRRGTDSRVIDCRGSRRATRQCGGFRSCLVRQTPAKQQGRSPEPSGLGGPVSTTELALSVACGPRATYLAPHVDRAARRYLLHPVLLVAVLACESRCRMDAVGKRGEVCAMQLLGVARNGHSRRALRRSPGLCISTGARWLALRQTECAHLGALAIGGYNARECRHGKRYARKVLATVERIWKAIREARAETS
jgi:hypothetical protein